MTRCLNSKCNFKHGFFSCNLPVDTIQLIVHVEMRRGKHTLKKDKEKRTEKFRSQAKQMDRDSSICPLYSLTHSSSSNSGAWLPSPEFEYKPKLFEDPRNNESSKENMLPLESAQIPVLNIEENDFLECTEKLLGTDNRWEAHVPQQVPLPRTSSLCPNNHQLGSLEQLETLM